MPLKTTENQSVLPLPSHPAVALLARYNLLECLSDGFLKSPELYSFSYPDPGWMAPRHLLLFLQPVDDTSFQDEWDDKPENFRIQVRVRIPVDRPLWRITEDYRPVPATRVEEGDVAVLLPFGLPTTEIECALFRNEGEREDFINISFGNVDPGVLKTGIIPSRGRTEISSSRLKNAIRQVSPRQMITEAYRAASSLTGGLLASEALLTSNTSNMSDNSLEWALTLLSPVVSEKEIVAFKKKYADKLTSNPDVGRLIRVSELTYQVVKGKTFRSIAEHQIKDQYVPSSPEDELLFRIIVVSLVRCQPDVNIYEFLESVQQQFDTLAPSMSVGESGDISKVQKALSLIMAILNAENTLPEGLARWPAALAGLLLFALRPVPEMTLTWQSEQKELHFTDTSLLYAMVFAGLRSGLSRFPLSLRNTPNFQWIQAMQTAFLDVLVPDYYDIQPAQGFVLKAQKQKGTETLLFRLAGGTGSITGAVLNLRSIPVSPAPQDVLVVQPIPAVTETTDHDQVTSEPSAGNSLGSIETSTEQTQPDPVCLPPEEQQITSDEEKIIQRFKSPQKGDTELERLAIMVSRHLQWRDCIRQVFVLDKVSFQLMNTDRGIVLEIDEFLPSEKQIQWNRFCKRLRETDLEEFQRAVHTVCQAKDR